MLKVELATAKEKNSVAALWRECFGESDRYLAWYFDKVFCPENTYIIKQGDKVISSVQAIPKTFCICGKKQEAYYVAGVGTLKEYRRKGFSRKIMERLIEEKGDKLLFLNTSCPELYYRYGFENRFYLNETKGIVQGGAYLGETQGSCTKLYKEFVQRFDIYVQRTEKDFENILFDSQIKYGNNAYIIYRLKNGVANILEAVYQRPEDAERLIMSLEATEYTLRAPISDKEGVSRPHAMARGEGHLGSYYINMMEWM